MAVAQGSNPVFLNNWIFFFSSVNWIVDQGQPEIVNGSTGKTINDSTSRLSKKCREHKIFFKKRL